MPGGIFLTKDDAPIDKQQDQQENEWQCVPYRGFSNSIITVLANISGVVIFLFLLLPLASPLVVCLYIVLSFRNRFRRFISSLSCYIWKKKKRLKQE